MATTCTDEGELPQEEGDLIGGEEDGEIIGESCNNSEEEEEEKEIKEQKEGEDWILVVKGPKRKRKASSEQNDSVLPKTKKSKRKRLVCYNEADPDETTAPPVAEPIESLTQNQKGLLRYISDIATSSKLSKPRVVDSKTSDFQAVLRHILCGEPAVVGKKGQAVYVELLRKAKVVVIWLSCVSRQDFIESGDETFKGLKSLMNGYFYITHPGSDRFVQFGLEAFMELEEEKATKEANVSNDSTLVCDFTKKNCILTHHQLIENEFPLPPSPSPSRSPSLPPSPSLVPPSKSPPSPSLPPSSTTPLSPSLPPPPSPPQPSSPNNIEEAPFITLLDPWPSNITEYLQDPAISDYPLFAIDCEMVKTTTGSELARVSIINEDMTCVYSTLVKPDNPVLDYLTRFSGVNEDMLQPIQVTLKDVQAQLVRLLPPKCILVGHSLENDLIALKLYHPFIIDTALLFTPAATPRFKPSLKKVVKKLLNKDIQSSTEGHDPTEDARSCMELVLKKLTVGPLCTIQWGQYKRRLPVYIASCGLTTRVIDKQSLASLYTDRSETNGLPVSSDEEAVSVTVSTVHETRFLFTQLHALEKLLRQEEGREVSKEERTLTLSSLDKYSSDIINSCPKGTLALVVCGSSHIKEVRELQRDPNACPKVLKTAVKKAREGLVMVAYK